MQMKGWRQRIASSSFKDYGTWVKRLKYGLISSCNTYSFWYYFMSNTYRMTQVFDNNLTFERQEQNRNDLGMDHRNLGQVLGPKPQVYHPGVGRWWKYRVTVQGPAYVEWLCCEPHETVRWCCDSTYRYVSMIGGYVSSKSNLAYCSGQKVYTQAQGRACVKYRTCMHDIVHFTCI